MTLRDPRGPPRHGLIGCGLALFVAAPVFVWRAIASWREGSPASDYVVFAVVCTVVSLILLWAGWRMSERAGRG